MYKFIALILLSFVLGPAKSNAYVLTPPECQFGKMVSCIKSGKLSYVVVYSTIMFTDYDDLKYIADLIPEDQQFPTVYLASSGGSLTTAYNIGRLFRERNVTVKSGNPVSGDAYTKCISSCVIIAAGAVKRFLVHIGLHSPATYDKDNNKKEFTEERFKILEQYLNEMGMDPRLFMMIKNTANDEILQISYNPNMRGKDQYIVQLGFYQAETAEEDNQQSKPINFTHVLYGRESLVFAAMNGSTGALKRLVDEYTYGTDKIQPDSERARVWLEIGADKNDIWSLHNLGVFHMKMKNSSAAVPYFRRAAQLGYAGSQNNYGWHLYKGDGVKKNKAEALYWITRAAEQGEPFAYGSLCQISAAADVFSADKIETMKWCRLASDDMPIGKARDKAFDLKEKFASKMTDDEISAANHLVFMWQPLKQTKNLMKDIDDKEKPDLKRYM